MDSVEGLQEKDSELRSLDPEVEEVSQALNDLLEEFSTLRSEVEAIDSQAFEKNVSLLADMVRAGLTSLKSFSHHRVCIRIYLYVYLGKDSDILKFAYYLL